MYMVYIDSFSHSRYFKSITTQRLSDYSIDTVSELSRQALQVNVSEGLAQGPYVVAGVGFEPAILRIQGTELTIEPPAP